MAASSNGIACKRGTGPRTLGPAKKSRSSSASFWALSKVRLATTSRSEFSLAHCSAIARAAPPAPSTSTRRSRRSTENSSRTARANPRPSVLKPRNLPPPTLIRSEEHTSELQSLRHLVCRLLLEKKKPYDHTESLD